MNGSDTVWLSCVSCVGTAWSCVRGVRRVGHTDHGFSLCPCGISGAWWRVISCGTCGLVSCVCGVREVELKTVPRYHAHTAPRQPVTPAACSDALCRLCTVSGCGVGLCRCALANGVAVARWLRGNLSILLNSPTCNQHHATSRARKTDERNIIEKTVCTHSNRRTPRGRVPSPREASLRASCV